MPKYTFSRLAIVCEKFEVQAESEEAALEMIQNGEIEPEPNPEWIDYHSDEFELDYVEDELVTFLHSKDPELCRVG